ncbi:MAG: hypothetical protein HKO07_08820, partial [Pseudomonadales bacterium]|nr:hypothetical protein [Pseudomonadales bacterium]
AITLAMLLVVVGLRSGLLDAWRAQIPANAPNYFAVNISASEREAWQQTLGRASVHSQGLFAVARARLVAINGESVEQLIANDATARRALSREMVMTQATRLPLGNTIEQGVWHGGAGSAQVSVEQGIASRLKLVVGDWLQFSFANRTLDVQVTSIRALDWNSMQPNFYFILAPPLLEAYPYTYITSFFVPQPNPLQAGSIASTEFVLALGRAFPAVALIDIGALVAQLQRVLDRIGLAVQGLAVLNVAAALLVLIASLRASLQQRLREQTILRALGGRAAQLRRIAQVELSVSGLLAGVVGCGFGGLLVLLLGQRLFDMTILPGPATVSAVLLGSSLLVLLLGTRVLGSVYRASPLRAWRGRID